MNTQDQNHNCTTWGFIKGDERICLVREQGQREQGEGAGRGGRARGQGEGTGRGGRARGLLTSTVTSSTSRIVTAPVCCSAQSPADGSPWGSRKVCAVSRISSPRSLTFSTFVTSFFAFKSGARPVEGPLDPLPVEGPLDPLRLNSVCVCVATNCGCDSDRSRPSARP
jgi:hypothetical protein